MNQENEIINDIIEKYRLNLGEDYEYYGGTIINEVQYQDYIGCTYCVDDFVDEQGSPYVLMGAIPKIEHRSRLIVFFKSNGDTIIIPVDGSNWTLVGNGIPENVQKLNLEKANYLYNRKVLNLNKEAEEITNEERDNIIKQVRKNYKRKRLVVAGILSSVGWLALLILIFSFSIYSIAKNNDYILVIGFLMTIVLWIILSIITFLFFYTFPIRRLKKIKYKKEFFFCDMVSDFTNATNNVIGYTFNGKSANKEVNLLSGGLEKLIKDVHYGDILYKYSDSKNFSAYCVLLKKDNLDIDK